MDVDTPSGCKIHVGTQAMNFRRDGMEVQSPFTDGIISDWEALETLWDHALK
jgi:actin-like protein 6A